MQWSGGRGSGYTAAMAHNLIDRICCNIVVFTEITLATTGEDF
jgi:hypothetical protein